MSDFKGRPGRASRGARSGRPLGPASARAATLTLALLAGGCGSLLGIEDVDHEGGAIEGFGGAGGTAPPGEGGRAGAAGQSAGRAGRGGGTAGSRAGAGGGNAGGGPGGQGGGFEGAGGSVVGGAGGGPAVCPFETSDKNDTIAGATKLPTLGPCFGSETQSVLRKGEVDWFALSFNDNDPLCDVTPFASFSGLGAGAQVCVFVRPDELDPGMVLGCPAGFTPSNDGGPGFTGCCGEGEGEVDYDYDASIDGSGQVLIRVSNLGAAAPCVQYGLAYQM